jgi:hypothetical protein
VSERERGGRGPAARDQNRRPTKAEKREQARIDREEIQRRMARRKKNRALGTGLVVGGIVIAILLVFLLPNDTAAPPADDLLAQAAQARTAAGCTDVRNPGSYDGVSDPSDPNYHDQTHVTAGGTFPAMPAFETYPSIPPTSGPHNPQTARAGVYDVSPPMDLVLHSLEHGAAVVWYDPDAPGDLIDQIRDFYGQDVGDASVGQDRVIVAPYDYPDEGDAGRLPPGTQMSLVAWHRIQDCGQVNAAAAYDFTSQFAYPGTSGRQYAGEAPEAGATM